MADTSSRKNLYTVLALVVVAGAIATWVIAKNYTPDEGGWDPNAVIVGLLIGFAANSFVLILLLLTLRTAVQTIQKAEEIKALGDEKEHVILIEGIGEAYASRLNQNKIITIRQLMDANAEDVAAKIGVTAALVRDWQSAGQLMQVKGVGPQYAEILVMAGCRTIGGLAQSDPVALTAKIDAIEERRKKAPVTGVNITQKHVERWVNSAKQYLQTH